MKLIKYDEIDNLDGNLIGKLYKKHNNKVLYNLFKYTDICKNFKNASGMYVYDEEGREYLDFLGGFGALSLGHNDERILEAINQAQSSPNMLQTSVNRYAAVLANNISFITKEEFSNCLFTSCGTETVEEAIKLAMLYKKGGNIIYFTGAYHGKTLGSLSALGNKIKDNYTTIFYNFVEVPFGDIEAFENVISQSKKVGIDITAVLAEPIQGEGGINVPSRDFFKEVRKLCTKNDIIFILDEIQTGLGRCGTMFCYEQFGFIPDILCLSKALSGGIMPIGCMAVEETLWEDTYGKFKYGTLPNSTFGGNTLSCAAAIKTIEIISEDKLSQRSAQMGCYAKSLLKQLKSKYKIIKDVRGKGLFIGIEFGSSIGTLPPKAAELIISEIISKLLNEYGIITGFTNNNPAVLRVEPPLIVEKEQIEYFVDSLDKVLSEENTIPKLGINSVKNVKNAFTFTSVKS